MLGAPRPGEIQDVYLSLLLSNQCIQPGRPYDHLFSMREALLPLIAAVL